MYVAGSSIRPLWASSQTSAVRHLGRWLLAGVLVALAGWLLARVAFGGTPPEYQTVVVQPGDTLWSIAAAHYPAADPRERVDAIEALNGLSSPRIQVGETLELPPA
jgi:nucleoid-associated protein YgaU